MDIHKKITNLVRSKRTQIPTLPVIVDNILHAARDDRTSATGLANYITKDQAISNKILRMANSAYYGLMKKVDSIPRAITIIGFNEVIGLTIGMSVFSTFSQSELKGILDIRDLWLHSIGCATAAKALAKRAGPDLADSIFLNGLLHDMGKVIFAEYFSNEYRAVLEDAKASEVVLFKKEKEILGIDHARLTGLLMERWNFPDSLLLSSRYHHRSLECPLEYRRHAMIVEIADYICQEADIGKSGNSGHSEIETVSRKLEVTSEEIEQTTGELREQRSIIEEFLKLIS